MRWLIVSMVSSADSASSSSTDVAGDDALSLFGEESDEGIGETATDAILNAQWRRGGRKSKMMDVEKNPK